MIEERLPKYSLERMKHPVVLVRGILLPYFSVATFELETPRLSLLQIERQCLLNADITDTPNTFWPWQAVDEQIEETSTMEYDSCFREDAHSNFLWMVIILCSFRLLADDYSFTFVFLGSYTVE